ncbi:hypothetical protein H2203_006877 [Taxawa tesnikishii (nom. ined.)]|nr:hypothetical protein H2203_006877 [Dothideales sp. JES 119]
MGLAGGGFLRLFQTFLYALEFCCAGIILGIYSYFLAVLADRDLPIAAWKKAVEGISGAAVVYLILAVLLTCFLGGVSFFAFLAIVLDICFAGGFIAIAVMTRHGASSCSGNVNTPLGSGPSNSHASGYGANGFGFGSNQNSTYAPNLGLACRLNTAAFAVSIIGAFLFLITALMQVFLVRHHKKEKRFGPSPANNYTSGSGKARFWQRKPKKTTTKDAELGTYGAGVPASGLAAPQADHSPYKEVDNTATAPLTHQHHAPHGAHGGYYTQPQGTGVNPYGYDNTRTTGTNF